MRFYHYKGKAARFAKPTPVEPWTGVYNATTPQHSCPMFHNHPDAAHPESEDCLFLNVWQPAPAGLVGTAHYNVLVYIHGGSFLGGSIFPHNYDSRQLAHDGNMVVVVVNYRLGALGFLYGGDGQHEGNYGLYDQLLALQWVQENIVHFGGDPTQVTLMGESAGSWSVSAHIISPLAKGLFVRAIMQSGSIITPIKSTKEALKDTQLLATELHCSHSNLTEMIDCLRTKPFADFQAITIMVVQ